MFLIVLLHYNIIKYLFNAFMAWGPTGGGRGQTGRAKHHLAHSNIPKIKKVKKMLDK